MNINQEEHVQEPNTSMVQATVSLLKDQACIILSLLTWIKEKIQFYYQCKGHQRLNWKKQPAMLIYALSYFDTLCVAATDGLGEGESEVEKDKNSCDRNEECSVLKGLASSPEVCFHSLIGESQCRSKQPSE